MTSSFHVRIRILWKEVGYLFWVWINSSEDTDVLKRTLGRLKKVMTSYDQTRRRHDVWKKTSDLRSLGDVWFTTFSGRLVYDVMKTFDLRCLEDVQFGTSWKHQIHNVFRTLDLRREDLRFTSSWRRPIYVVLKTSNLRRLEDFWFVTLEDVCETTSVLQLRSDVYATSKEMIFSYFVLSEIFRKFYVLQLRLVFRYGILYKSMEWFIYDRHLRHERRNHC